jgi:hypothetical protein
MTTTPTLWLAATQVNVTDSVEGVGNSQSASKIVAIGGGRFVVIWEDDTRTFSFGLEPNDIGTHIFDPLGGSAGDDFTGNVIYQDLDQSQADLVATSDGGFAIAYKSDDAAGAGDGQNIDVDRFDSKDSFESFQDFRQGFGGPAGVDESRPTLTALADGNYAIVYEQNDGTDKNLVGHIVTDGKIGTAFTIEGGTDDSAGPDAATLGNGNWVVAYQKNNTADTATEIRYSVRDALGVNVLDTVVEAAAASNDFAPVVTGLIGSSGFVVAWQKDDLVAAGTDGFRVAVYSGSGAVPTIFDSTSFAATAGPHAQPAIAPLQDGGFVIVWRDDGSDTIRGHRFNAAGVEIGVEFTVADVDDLSQPQVALLGDGRIAISMTNTDGTGDNDVYVAIWDPRTGPVTGTAGDDVLTNRVEGGTINGLAGNDTMYGSAADDIFRVGEAGDVIVEGKGGGTADRVIATVSYVLSAGAEVELLTTNSSGATVAINLTGNALHQEIFGNAGANTLKDGGGAADLLKGLGGNDTYLVYAAGTTVAEGSTGGTDRILAAVDFALGAGQYVETLATTNGSGTSGIDLTGNALAQSITGNAGANILSDGGKGAADTMTGLGGNDTYRVYNSGDVIVETATQGTADKVAAAVDYKLGTGVHVEAMTTNGSTGTAGIDLTGNELVQSITGNAGSNILDGKGGNDTLSGLGGKDIFAFTTALGASNIDTIADFSVVDDTIQLENAVFTALAVTGPLLSGYFRANSTGTAQDSNDHIIYETDTGKLFYDADGNGAGAGIHFATLSVGLALTNADFSVA